MHLKIFEAWNFVFVNTQKKKKKGGGGGGVRMSLVPLAVAAWGDRQTGKINYLSYIDNHHHHIKRPMPHRPFDRSPLLFICYEFFN